MRVSTAPYCNGRPTVLFRTYMYKFTILLSAFVYEVSTTLRTVEP